MRPAPPEFGDALASSTGAVTVASFWHAGRLVTPPGARASAAVPLIDGELDHAARSAVPDHVSITIPRRDPATGLSWEPAGPSSPVGHNGQRVKLARGIVRPSGALMVDLGFYRIEDWTVAGDTVQIEADDLLAILDHEMPVPYAPSGDTFSTALRRLCWTWLPTSIDPALVDRSVPSSLAWDGNRIAALNDLLAAWPAALTMTAQGIAHIHPPVTPEPARELTHGIDGTLIAMGRSGRGSDVSNAFAVTGAASADPNIPPVSAVEYHDDPTSPWSYSGPFGPHPAKFASPLLTTEDQCRAAARTLLAKALRLADTREVEIPADPRIDAATAFTITGEPGVWDVGNYNLPLAPAGGPMRMTLERRL